MALVALLPEGEIVPLATRTTPPVGKAEAVLEEAAETVDAADEVDAVELVAVDADVAVEVGRMLVRVAP